MKKIHILTLGCPKNSVDSEVLAGRFDPEDWTLVDRVEECDIALVNTCGFIQPAVEESIDVILDLEEMKAQGTLEKICVVGCLVNRYGEDLKKEFPSVDLWAEAEDWDSLARALGIDSPRRGRRILTESPWTRYLKVGEGCDTRCSFCTIPSIRGPLRSRDPKDIVAEAVKLAEEGAKELCLVGQDLTVYGSDLSKRGSLSGLLDAMEADLPGDIWLRLFYLHPSRVDEVFLERVLNSSRILPWLDIPIQHVDADVLRRMNRPPVEEHIRKLFKAGRRMFPDFAFRTTIMVGFPGETEKAFQSLLDFVEDVAFDRLGAFTFCPEEGTPAASMPDQIPQEEKDRRYAELMELQQSISLTRQRGFVGKEMDVLIEEVDEEDGIRWGRSFRDAPEIDGLVSISGAKDDVPGDMVRVSITDASEYDLFGERVCSDG
ncbi:MAG: 30S ribosomal protein S12 methylthiotransferase RimO [Synergistota bacterium]|nr:30S ribosomal protein S12 methylthiotransferase RimO [Synergistota bacterium]